MAAARVTPSRPGGASTATGRGMRAAPGRDGSVRQVMGRARAARTPRRETAPGARRRPRRRKPGGGVTGRFGRETAPDGRRGLRWPDGLRSRPHDADRERRAGERASVWPRSFAWNSLAIDRMAKASPPIAGSRRQPFEFPGFPCASRRGAGRARAGMPGRRHPGFSSKSENPRRSPAGENGQIVGLKVAVTWTPQSSAGSCRAAPTDVAQESRLLP